LGKLGWTEREYYTSSPEAFFFATRGYFSKLQDESLAVRNLANIVFQLGGGKGQFDKHWPLAGVEPKEREVIVMDKEMWDRIKNRDNIK